MGISASRDPVNIQAPDFIRACWDWEPSNNQQFLKILDDAIANEAAYVSRDQDGCSGLHICVIKGNEEGTKILAKAFPRLTTSSNHKSLSPIHSAIITKNYNIAKLLLETKDLNMLYQTDSEGNTAIHHACSMDNYELLDEMIKIEKSVHLLELKNLKSQTGMLLSLQNCENPRPFVELFLKVHPEGVHISDYEGRTALHLATLKDDKEVVQMLLKNNSVLGATTKKGQGVLHLCALAGAKNCFSYYLNETDPPVNLRDISGNSPLHYAALNHNLVEYVQILIKKGADLQFKNRDNQTPFEYLQENLKTGELSQSDFVEMLKLLDCPTKPEPKRSVKIQFCSDIHVEFGSKGVLEATAPYLALLGDIGVTKKQEYRSYVLEQAEKFQKVFVIAGNHEFYQNTYQKSLEEIQDICKEKEHLLFMNNTSVLLDGVRFLGATLWSKVSAEQNEQVGYFLNDYRRIKKAKEDGKEVLLKTEDTCKWHEETVEWLKQEINSAKQRNEPVVILTHHCPLWKLGCSASHDYGVGFNTAFCTDLKELYGSPVVLWLYGHTHWFNDITINGTRFLSNPGGYPQEKMPFTNNFSVQVDFPC